MLRPELSVGIEPTTPCLQGRCSTIELRQQTSPRGHLQPQMRGHGERGRSGAEGSRTLKTCVQGKSASRCTTPRYYRQWSGGGSNPYSENAILVSSRWTTAPGTTCWDDRHRTCNLLSQSQLLCQLSYIPMRTKVGSLGFAPRPSGYRPSALHATPRTIEVDVLVRLAA